MNKSQAAFLMSAERLFSLGRPVYFWTITFVKVYPDWYYPSLWKGFITVVGNLHGGYINGLRVIEAHKEHGLHYHMLINTRVSVHLMRRIGKRFGMGRMHVVKADKNAPKYLAKYLTKRGPKLFSVRKWHTVGCFQGVTQNELVIDSAYMRERRKLNIEGRLKIGCEHLLQTAFETHGKRGLKKCWQLLEAGRPASAAKLVSPNIEVTERGGLRYHKSVTAIKFRVTKASSPVY